MVAMGDWLYLIIGLAVVGVAAVVGLLTTGRKARTPRGGTDVLAPPSAGVPAPAEPSAPAAPVEASPESPGAPTLERPEGTASRLVRLRQRLVGDQHGAGREQRRKAAGQPGAQAPAGGLVAAADVDMHQGRPGTEPGHGLRQGRLQFAVEQVVGIGDAVGMGRDLTVEAEDLAAGQDLAQVVEGAAVGQAQFQDMAVQALDQARGKAQAGALGGQAPDDAVETAHGPRGVTAGPPPWETASRNCAVVRSTRRASSRMISIDIEGN